MISAGSAALALAATFAVLCAPVRGKVYDRCELARELASRLGVPIAATATWVCIAYHESRFDTTAIGRLNSDSSLDHGLFQISDIYWCSHNSEGGKACHLPCTALRDEDLTDDLACALQIHEEHARLSGDGFNAWTVYHLYCDGQKNVKKYVAGCYEKETSAYKVNYFDDSAFENADTNVTAVDLYDNLIYKKEPAPTLKPATTLFDIDKLLPITTPKYVPTVSSTKGQDITFEKSSTRKYFETSTVKLQTNKKEEKSTKTTSSTTPSTTITTTPKPTTTRKPYTFPYTLPTLTTKPFVFKPIFKFPTLKPYTISTDIKSTTPTFKFTTTKLPITTTKAPITTSKPTITSKSPTTTLKTTSTTLKTTTSTTRKPTYSTFYTTPRNSYFNTTTRNPYFTATSKAISTSTTRPTTTTFKPYTTTKKYVFSSTTQGSINKSTRSRVIHIQIFPLPTSAPDKGKVSSYSTSLFTTPSTKSYNWSTKRLPVTSYSSKYQPMTTAYKFGTTTVKTPVTSAYGVTFKWPSLFNKTEPVQKTVFGFGTALNSLQLKNNSTSSILKTVEKNKRET